LSTEWRLMRSELSTELQEAILELASKGDREKLKRAAKKFEEEGELSRELNVVLSALLKDDGGAFLRQCIELGVEKHIEALSEVLKIASQTGVMQDDVRELRVWREVLSIAAKSCGTSA